VVNRNEIHGQIAILTEKISFLNSKLANDERLHPVETDLLCSYVNELHALIEHLGIQKSDLTGNEEISQDQPTSKKIEESTLVENRQALTNSESEHNLPNLENIEVMEAAEIVNKKKRADANPQGDEHHAVSLNEKLKSETTALADKLKGVRKKNINELFDLNERYKYIEGLFSGSTDQYNKAMHDLGRFTSRREGELYIKNIEAVYSWQKNQALADRFAGQVLHFLE